MVSSCLLGVNCRYDGTNCLNQNLLKYLKDKNVISVCPEVLGGLTTPRNPSEIVDNSVYDNQGNDITQQFIIGAEKVLNLVLKNNIQIAILKSNSPSCGCGKIYDGTFNNILVDGDGICTRLLKENKIKIINSDDFY